MKTIDVKFEIAQLPRWARQFEIFLLAEKDLPQILLCLKFYLNHVGYKAE